MAVYKWERYDDLCYVILFKRTSRYKRKKKHYQETSFNAHSDETAFTKRKLV